jgi:hypothetical protein
MVLNHTDFRLRLSKSGVGAHRGEYFEPGEERGVNLWIEACEKEENWGDWGNILEIIRIYVGPHGGEGAHFLYNLWRNGNQICYSKASDANHGWPGKCVPLNCAVGGDRMLTVAGKLENIEAVTIELKSWS